MLHVVSALALAAFKGSAGCPCIDVTERLLEYELPNQSCIVKLPSFEAEHTCLPRGFGSYHCSDWDSNSSEVCLTLPRPSWCSMPWCYVDPLQCRFSDHDVQRGSYFTMLDPPIFFSYGTCMAPGTTYDIGAYLTYSTSARFHHALNDKHLRVVIPTMDYPTHFKRHPATSQIVVGAGQLYQNDSVPFEGSMIDYLDALFATANAASVSYTWSSNFARKQSSSAHTAAVIEVSQGMVDVGGSTFWATTERANISAFS